LHTSSDCTSTNSLKTTLRDLVVAFVLATTRSFTVLTHDVSKSSCVYSSLEHNYYRAAACSLLTFGKPRNSGGKVSPTNFVAIYLDDLSGN
jgi:hypothetical protein